QRIDDVEQVQQGLRTGRAVFLDLTPRGALVEEAVAELGERHRLAQWVLEARGLEPRAHGGERRVHALGHHRPRTGVALDAGHLAIVVTLQESQRAVHQVAVRRHQLVVVAPKELVHREIGVARLRHIRRDHVAYRVRVVAREQLGHPDRPAAARGDLLARQVHVLVGRDVVGQAQPTAPYYHRPPYGRV